MTTYYDHRAERTAAQAEADTRRAQAEALRAETMLRLERERRQMEREDTQAKRLDKSAKTTAKKVRRAERRAASRRAASALTNAVKSRGHSIVAAAAMGSPMFIAWGGQLAFAEDVMHLGAAAFTLPVAMEGSVLYNAYLTHRAIEKRLPTIRYRLMTWVMAANAAGMNLWHQVDKAATTTDPWAGLQVGAVYAASSLLGIVMWEMKAALDRQAASRRSGAEIRRDLWRRLRYPRISWAAASIRAAQGSTVEDAWTAAWIDRYGVGPAASRRDRRLARKIVRYQSKADKEAAKTGRLGIVDGAIVGRPVLDLAPASPEGDKALEELRSWDGAAAARRAMRRASLAVLSVRSPVTPAEVTPAVTDEVMGGVITSPLLDLRPALPETPRVTPLMTPNVTLEGATEPVINESDEATKTEVMRAFWDSERAHGRYPRPIELARHANADRGLASRLRRVWVEELSGWEKRRARLTRDRGTNGHHTPLADDVPTTTTEVS
ncbi:DUF2637 domain-containing protein [Planotetraspora sp. A-T 1434]|uniref:DUF2637 domain-containing protein n=1 Tax=Planotetraspora sp. A-T 1434 TaxID=2979219 RepID=UPI0021C0BF06|nr:DUF2637 domain-containing protein [Planotetraspora sp. A-T 1434]MCT9932473.1 DUF2637 domain-containing protein [Planotetraspora sp. A-T 1434]